MQVIRQAAERIGDAVDKVGSEGVISVEEAKGAEAAVEVVHGMQFDRGYRSPYFVTDPERPEPAPKREPRATALE